MSAQFEFKGLFFTKHALKRLGERGLSVSDVWAVWHNPQGSKAASSKGAFVYWRVYGQKKIEVVAKKSENNHWVVISVWVRREEKFSKETFLSFLLRRIFH